MSPVLLAGLLFVFFGLLNEAVVGDIRRLFDRQYLFDRRRRGGYSAQRLLYGRAFIFIGVMCLIVGGLSWLG